MPTMTHRERVLAAFAHRQPDRVPIDLGATRVSSLVVEEYDRLKATLGVEAPSMLCERMMRVVHVDERILRALDIDTRAVHPGNPVRTPFVDLGTNGYRDCWGVERMQMPGCWYHDQLKYPLAGEISLADIARYPWPDPEDPGLVVGLAERVAWIRQHTDAAAVLTLPAPFVHITQYLRGFEEWYTDFLLSPQRLEALFDTVLDITMAWTRRLLAAVGKDVDIVICSDDLGGQNGLLFSHEHYVRYIKPRHARFFALVHALTPAYLALHCCGSVAAILDDLVETGVQALNPIQVTAAGMDPVALKRRYGRQLLFWGAMDTQGVLARGTVQDVCRMVEERIEQMGEDGGYILAACHNIQPDVPVENVLAMYRHAREYVPSFGK